VLALAAAGVFLAVIQGFDLANHRLLPDVARRIHSVDEHVFTGLVGSSWVGIAAIALLPGICEELLFRGALQPRLGLVATALLFTSIHPQYGMSLDLAGLFLIALGLGMIRKYTNTTTSISAHVAYNLLATFSLAGPVLYAALGVEVVLLGVAGYAIWPQVRRMRATAP
jgi:membrane protease YdiL (CAAX protease family)